jgi:hypothetical protein
MFIVSMIAIRSAPWALFLRETENSAVPPNVHAYIHRYIVTYVVVANNSVHKLTTRSKQGCQIVHDTISIQYNTIPKFSNQTASKM